MCEKKSPTLKPVELILVLFAVRKIEFLKSNAENRLPMSFCSNPNAFMCLMANVCPSSTPQLVLAARNPCRSLIPSLSPSPRLSSPLPPPPSPPSSSPFSSTPPPSLSPLPLPSFPSPLLPPSLPPSLPSPSPSTPLSSPLSPLPLPPLLSPLPLPSPPLPPSPPPLLPLTSPSLPTLLPSLPPSPSLPLPSLPSPPSPSLSSPPLLPSLLPPPFPPPSSLFSQSPRTTSVFRHRNSDWRLACSRVEQKIPWSRYRPNASHCGRATTCPSTPANVLPQIIHFLPGSSILPHIPDVPQIQGAPFPGTPHRRPCPK